MTDQHWVAIGEDNEDTAKASAGRKIVDGILFRVAVSINGRRCVALLDSGASQSYIAPDTVTLCELNCVPVVMHLELADGTKIESTEQTQDTLCTLGECVGKNVIHRDMFVEQCGYSTWDGLASEMEPCNRLETPGPLHFCEWEVDPS